MIQSMISPKKSTTTPPVISLTDPKVVAVDGGELKQVDQFHGDVLEKPRKLISCGNKSTQNAGIQQEVSICQISDIMAIPEDDENSSDYTGSNDRITKSSSKDCRCDITEHMLFDILLWLPVTTLVRFKSICKSWYALIDSSVFIAQHFDQNCGRDKLLCFLNQYNEDDGFYGNKICLLSGNKYEVYNNVNVDCGQFGYVVESFVSLALSTNGIICLVYGNHQEVALWNPAMKQLRPLSKSSVFDRSKGDCVYFGFGYDVKSNDYKVVRTVIRKGSMHKYVVEVYNLRADSWRTILEDVVFSFKSLWGGPINKNGTCFWIASDNTHDDDDGDDGDDSLVSFDFNDETYKTMPLPVQNKTILPTLGFLSDKLAYMYGLDDFLHGFGYHEIWVLHEYGVKDSWSKVWKIGPTTIPWNDDIRFPFGFSKNGDYLLLTNASSLDGGFLYLYDLGTEENEYLEVQQLHQGLQFFDHYTESLISVKRVNDAN